MSIAAVVTRGFGSFGSIADVTTAGFLPEYTSVDLGTVSFNAVGDLTALVPTTQNTLLGTVTFTGTGDVTVPAPTTQNTLLGTVTFTGTGDVTEVDVSVENKFVYLSRVNFKGTGDVSLGIMNHEYNLESVTFNGEGSVTSESPNSFTKVRRRPLRSKAFNRK